MFHSRVAVWKNAPFTRFLLPLMIGIVLQWYFQFPVHLPWLAFGLSMVVAFASFLSSGFTGFRLSVLYGSAVMAMFLSLGSLLTWYKDIRHQGNWLGTTYHPGDLVIAILTEAPVEKENSYKAMATVEIISAASEKRTAAGGHLVIYFKKDTMLSPIDVGSQIIFRNRLQEIRNAGNPGGFDYKRYSLFQGITHQVYLKSGEFVVLKGKKDFFHERALSSIRKKVLSVLRRNISKEKERGLAEALLIGYKDDLDKNLIQSYTNTGVVHVIAISGLHLGLIYWVLIQILRPFNKQKMLRWMSPVIIIAGLWIFSLVAGAQPSVLRSAVMFTCIVLAKSFARKTSIYNSLAFSAFVLLCVNPYWLWDVGFQLSYAAVLSIVIFMKPVYNWFYIKNKVVDFAWKLTAVTIAAQLLTTPLSIFHFHQFPIYFLLTNIVAVPLSSVILLGELILCAFSFIPFIGFVLGKVLTWLLWWMNSYIEGIESLPYSIWGALQISVTQAALLTLAVAAIGYWLLEKQRSATWVALAALMLFASFRFVSFYQSMKQAKLVVYNIPRHRAIDVIKGRDYFFIGDSALVVDDLAINLHIKPCRVLHRIQSCDQVPNFMRDGNFLQLGAKRVLLIDRTILFDSCVTRTHVDALIISNNPRISLIDISKTFTIGSVVFDGSVPIWKIRYWEKDCRRLRIPFYDVSEKGAFVMNLN